MKIWIIIYEYFSFSNNDEDLFVYLRIIDNFISYLLTLVLNIMRSANW